MKKENSIIYLTIGALILWNVWLSSPQKIENNGPNYEMLQQIYKDVKRSDQSHELQIKNLQNEINQDSVIVYSATRSERDSLRAIYNPR